MPGKHCIDEIGGEITIPTLCWQESKKKGISGQIVAPKNGISQ